MTQVVGTNRTLGAANATSYSKFIVLNYISSLVTQKIFTAPFPCVVTGIQGVTRVAGSGGAATVAFFKSASGVTVGNGVALNSGSFDLVGTADINQELTLSTTASALQLAAGDSIGYVLTGTATSAVGSITITIEPLS